jgi:serine-type D-Ala-D-Ala carboxypeptidase
MAAIGTGKQSGTDQLRLGDPRRSVSRRVPLTLLSSLGAALFAACAGGRPNSGLESSSAKPSLAPSLLDPTLEPLTPDATTSVTPPSPQDLPADIESASAKADPAQAAAQAVDAAMVRGIEEARCPGGVVLVRHRGRVIVHRAYGYASMHLSATASATVPVPARLDTLYDLASITKLFTATCVLRLVEDGHLRLDEPVTRILPRFGTNGKAPITIRHLLTHTSGLPALLRLWELEATPEARRGRVHDVAPTHLPGTIYRYSDLGPMVLGYVIERVTGAPLDRVVVDFVTGPLRMEQVHFRPPADLRPRIAPTEDSSAVGRGLVWGEVHDENAWSLGGVSGHAGLFGTAEDLGIFGQAFLQGGAYAGARLLNPETVAEMTRNHAGKLAQRALGWELDNASFMGRLAAPGTFGHTGFTGTSIVVEPQRQLVVVLLTNRVHPTRNGPSIHPVRRAVADAALAMVEAE